AAGKQTDSANNIAASFGRPPSLAVPADYSSDSSSDSDWDSDDEEEEQGTRHKPAPPASAPSASSRVSRANSLLTPPSPLGATSPRYRLQGKLESAAAFDWTATSKLLDGLPELTIDTASRPPRHPAPRHTRDRSCPLRQEEYVSLMAQHVQLPPATGIRARRPSAPAIY
ncbi:hypothetical protein MMC34_008661, partial [Xylographa carneopallida]|nr:hypothetical protein [Xylographa carneopallida]